MYRTGGLWRRGLQCGEHRSLFSGPALLPRLASFAAEPLRCGGGGLRCKTAPAVFRSRSAAPNYADWSRGQFALSWRSLVRRASRNSLSRPGRIQLPNNPHDTVIVLLRRLRP